MNILAIGSLGPNKDRIRALLPLGHNIVYAYVDFTLDNKVLEPEIVCIPVPRRNLPNYVKDLIARYEVDIIYCLLNSSDGSNEVALELLDANIKTPIVRHYKEHACAPNDEERRVLMETDGQIYINQQSVDYFSKVYGIHPWSAHIMDADMIAERYMTDDFSPKQRAEDGRPHLLVAGGVSMLNDRQDVRRLCVEMSQRDVSVHLYGYTYSYSLKNDQHRPPTIHHEPTQRAYEHMAEKLPHIRYHNYIPPKQFVSEWSRYDAGVMHTQVTSADPMFSFEQMNYPYRYSAYLAAGLPLIVQRGGQDAVEELIEKHRIGIVFRDYDDLAEQLHDSQHMASLNDYVIKHRIDFSFDKHAPQLATILAEHIRK